MLRIRPPSRSPSGVQNYFEHSNYYQGGPDALKGHWFGKAGERLGLRSGSEIDKELFDRVIQNQHPFLNESITPRTRSDRRVGWDVTFSSPKSVSIAWALSQDDRILDALRDAVNDTLADMERDVLTRVHVGKQMHTEKIGNMLAATWLHTDARPEKDSIPMPQLHVHAFIANAGLVDGEGYKAIDISQLKKDAPLYEARFHSRLAESLSTRLGFGVERQGKKWFELKGFDRELIERFSERSTAIEAVARKKGITDPAKKAELGAKTRNRKAKEISMSELTPMWRNMLSDEEFQALGSRVKEHGPAAYSNDAARAAVVHAAEHRFSKEATIRERQLLTDAIWKGIGQASVQQIDDALGAHDLIRDGKKETAWVTTPAIVKEEQWMLRYVRRGIGTQSPLASKAAIERSWLSDEQQSAIRKLWHSRDRVMIMVGKAGVGKTTSSQELVEGIERQGTQVTVLAPTTKAVGVLRKDGFRAGTLQSFLKNEKVQQQAKDAVIFVDESGLVSSRQMAGLFHIADDLNARIILAGDSMQHAPVEYGRPLELLENETSTTKATIRTIRRQDDPAYRQAVEQLSRGQVAKGFDSLVSLGAIKELPDQERNLTLARAYADTLTQGHTAMVIAPTHVEKALVTDALRDELKSRGMISGTDRELVTYRRHDWTKAERQDAKLFSPGDMIEFRTKGKGGFRPGERARVTQVVDDRVLVRRSDGDISDLPLTSAGGFAVFSPVSRAFAVGDRVRITQNRRGTKGQPRLTNGMGYTVQGFTKDGHLRLGDGLNLDPTWGHIDHNWVTTSFSGQGDQADRMFVAQSRSSFPASSPRQAYVSASRGRTEIQWYTDNAKELRDAMSRDRSAGSATELHRNALRQQRAVRTKRHLRRLRYAAKRTQAFMQQQVARLMQFRQSDLQPRVSR